MGSSLVENKFVNQWTSNNQSHGRNRKKSDFRYFCSSTGLWVRPVLIRQNTLHYLFLTVQTFSGVNKKFDETGHIDKPARKHFGRAATLSVNRSPISYTSRRSWLYRSFRHICRSHRNTLAQLLRSRTKTKDSF